MKELIKFTLTLFSVAFGLLLVFCFATWLEPQFDPSGATAYIASSTKTFSAMVGVFITALVPIIFYGYARTRLFS